MVATSERHVLPKATPYYRSQRSPSSEGRGGRYSRPGSFGRNAKTMVMTGSRSADQKKVRFPPPRNWNPEAKWTQDCVMFKECGEKRAWEVRRFQETVSAAEAEGDRGEGALSSLLSAFAGA